MDVKPRKLPHQARAKATIDAIVEASTQLLLNQGYDRFTTARAAERAGVSVGSLYQYFPNKAALAAAVIDRCCEDFLIALDHALAGRPRITLAECIRAIVDVILVSHQLAPDLHRIVVDLAPRIGVAEKTERVNRKMAEAIEAMLRMHSEEIAPEIDLAIASTIVEILLVALAHRAALADPAAAREDAVASETTRMITRYLAVNRWRFLELVDRDPEERGRRDVILGVTTFAIVIFVIIFAFGSYSGWSPQYTVELRAKE